MKKDEVKKTKRAFSLVEVLIYIGITSTLLLAMTSFLGSVTTSKAKTQTISEVDTMGVQIMQLMTQTIRNATSINTPTIGTTSATLSLQVSGATKSPTVFDINVNKALEIIEGSSAAVTLTSNRVSPSGLIFSNLSRSSTPGTIRIQFTLTYNNPNGKQEYNDSQTFYGSATVR